MSSVYPGALYVPAHPSRYYGPETGRGPCSPIAICYHTPEEPADEIEVTPRYFQTPCTPQHCGATRWYADNDGDLFQCVPEPWGAIANGLDGKPAPAWSKPYSLNLQTENIEIEGYAHRLKETITGQQWATLLDWSVWCFLRWNIPRSPERMFGHYEVSVQRSDPGPWLLSEASGFKAEVLYRVNEYEKKVKELSEIVLGLELNRQREERERKAADAFQREVLIELAEGHAEKASRKLRDVYALTGEPYPYP